jgi:PAS domain-containing protein
MDPTDLAPASSRAELGRQLYAGSAIAQDTLGSWNVSTRAEDEFSRQSEARYRGLLEAAPDAMVVVDQAGRIVLLNLQAEKQFGYQRDELIGQQDRKSVV